MSTLTEAPSQQQERNYDGSLTSEEQIARATDLLSHPYNSLRNVCEKLNMDFRSIKGIISRNPELQRIHREAVAGLHDRLARLAGEQIERDILQGGVETKVLATVYGIATDKGMAQRAVEPGRTPPIHAEAVDVLTPFAQLVAQMTQALMQPAQPKLANAIEINSPASDAVVMPTRDEDAGAVSAGTVARSDEGRGVLSQEGNNETSEKDKAKGLNVQSSIREGEGKTDCKPVTKRRNRARHKA